MWPISGITVCITLDSKLHAMHEQVQNITLPREKGWSVFLLYYMPVLVNIQGCIYCENRGVVWSEACFGGERLGFVRDLFTLP